MTVLSWPISSFMLPLAVLFTRTSTDSCVVLKPLASARTEYVPGTSPPEEYVPAPLVVAWTVCPVGPVMVTLALGTTAPVASVTVPEMLPFDTEVWANATEHNSSVDEATSASSVNRAMRRGGLRFTMLCHPFGIY